MMTNNGRNRRRRRWPASLVWLVVAGCLGFGPAANAQVNQLRAGSQPVYQPVIGQPSHAAAPSGGDAVGTDHLAGGQAESPFSGLLDRPSRSLSEPAREPARDGVEHPDVSSIIGRLAMSTMIVLCCCIAGLVLFKKFKLDGMFSFSRQVASATAAGPGPEIRVEAMLRLRGNRSLEIVRADQARLVIVSDSSGVQSVLPIGASFAEQIRKCESTREREALYSTHFDVADTDPPSRNRASLTRR